MEYTYYPGCSVKSSAPQYEESTLEVVNHLGIKLHELEDWNCCGATAYFSVKELTSFAISARNLAIASKENRELVTPCSGCYVILQKANKYMKEFDDVNKKVNEALAEADLSYDGNVHVKHTLEMFLDEPIREKIKSSLKKPLTDLRVACYSGCQLSRPQGEFDDPEMPTTLEEFTKNIGATPTNFPLKAACCGGSIMGTERDVGIRLVMNLLECADRDGAECMIVPCPLCQMNIDAYQSEARKKYNKKFDIPVLYFTQLLGLALGIDPKKLGFGKEIISAEKILKRFA